jgi:hypothetical protein
VQITHQPAPTAAGAPSGALPTLGASPAGGVPAAPPAPADARTSSRSTPAEAAAPMEIVVRVAGDADLADQIGRSRLFDLVTFDNVELQMGFSSNAPFAEVQHRVRTRLGLQPAQQRYWRWVDRPTGAYRPSAPLTPGTMTVGMMALACAGSARGLGTLDLFLEAPPVDAANLAALTEDTVLLFFKRYAPRVEPSLAYISCCMASRSARIRDLHALMGGAAGLPAGAELLVFKEVGFEPAVVIDLLQLDATVGGAGLNHGDILVFQEPMQADASSVQLRADDFLSTSRHIHAQMLGLNLGQLISDEPGGCARPLVSPAPRAPLPAAAPAGAGAAGAAPDPEKVSVAWARAQNALDELLEDRAVRHLFGAPVSTSKYPNYLRFVPDPRDLGTILRQLKAGEYADVYALRNDVRLCFDNCRAFNPLGHDARKIGDKASVDFERKWLSLGVDFMWEDAQGGYFAAQPAGGSAKPAWVGVCRALVDYLLHKVLGPRFSRIFFEPVDTVKLRVYTRKCPNPISFSEIRGRLGSGAYDGPANFYADVVLLLDNCYKYNVELYPSEYGQAGFAMETAFLRLWRNNPELSAAVPPRAPRLNPDDFRAHLAAGGASYAASQPRRPAATAHAGAPLEQQPAQQQQPALEPPPQQQQQQQQLSLQLEFHNTIRHITASQLGPKTVLGSGSHAVVYRSSWQGAVVAVKQQTKRSGAAADPKGCIYAEAALQDSIGHPNVVALYAVCPTTPALVMEFCERGSLLQMLREAKDGNAELRKELTWKRRVTMAVDAACGVLHLHDREVPILHRDLRSPNLLVAKDWKVKVADFGLSKPVLTNKTVMADCNPKWLAPELMNGDAASLGSDAFSFGVVMYELLVLEPPWKGHECAQSIMNAVYNGQRPAVPEGEELLALIADTNHTPPRHPPKACVNAYLALMRKCWAHDPAARPAFKEIVRELKRISILL